MLDNRALLRASFWTISLAVLCTSCIPIDQCTILYLCVFMYSMCPYLDILKVDLEHADSLGLGEQLDACDVVEVDDGGDHVELVIQHLADAVASPHQQTHQRLTVLELEHNIQKTVCFCL